MIILHDLGRWRLVEKLRRDRDGAKFSVSLHFEKTQKIQLIEDNAAIKIRIGDRYSDHINSFSHSK